MNKRILNRIMKEFNNKNMQTCLIKLLIECWNSDTPHFGGSGPHRYNGSDKTCCYCNRPINWKPFNAGYLAGQVTDLLDSQGNKK